MEDLFDDKPTKRKLFSTKSLGNMRAALRTGSNDLLIEGSYGSSPDLKRTNARQRIERLGLASTLSSVGSGDLNDLIPAQRVFSEPRFVGQPNRQPLNVLYPSLDGLELLRTLGRIPSSSKSELFVDVVVADSIKWSYVVRQVWCH